MPNPVDGGTAAEGETVEIFGGQFGVITKCLEELGAYEIRLPNGKLINLKSSSFKRVKRVAPLQAQSLQTASVQTASAPPAFQASESSTIVGELRAQVAQIQATTKAVRSEADNAKWALKTMQGVVKKLQAASSASMQEKSEQQAKLEHFQQREVALKEQAERAEAELVAAKKHAEKLESRQPAEREIGRAHV